MSRRLVPWTFRVGILLCAVLVLADGVMAFGPRRRVPNLLGTWDGFVQQAGDAGAPGLIRLDVSQQSGRRFLGDAALLDPEGARVFNTMNFAGTVVRDDFINGTGRARTGRVVFQSGLMTFEGDDGDAAVIEPQFRFVPARGRLSRLDSILLHPFPADNPPNIAGIGMGTFQSQIDPTFGGDLVVEIFPPVRGSFPGHLDFMPRSSLHPPFSWRSLATTNDQGRIVQIAQGRTGGLVLEGVTLPDGGGTSAFVGGFYRAIFLDGRRDFGAYNFNVVSPIR